MINENLNIVLKGLEYIYDDNFFLSLRKLFNAIDDTNLSINDKLLIILEISKIFYFKKTINNKSLFFNNLKSAIELFPKKNFEIFLLKVLVEYCREPLPKDIHETVEKFPTMPWLDILSKGQITSKKWMVDELTQLNLDLGTVFIVGGWVGLLPKLLFRSNLKIDKIRNFEIDKSTIDVADFFNKEYTYDNWKFKSIHQNMLNIDYNLHSWTAWSNKNNRMSHPITETTNTIINTSCDHLTPNEFDNWIDLIPKNKLVILQNNDFKDLDQHLNTVNNIDDFVESAKLKHVLYSGRLITEKYNRYMIIGIK